MWGPKPKSVWDRGERAAARHMRRAGCKVLARNYRLPIGEIDLLCLERSSGTIVIVEVKAREYDAGSSKSIDPTASITSRKRAKLVQLAKTLKKQPQYTNRPIRIDVVSVRFERGSRQPEIRHYPGCVSDS